VLSGHRSLVRETRRFRSPSRGARPGILKAEFVDEGKRADSGQGGKNPSVIRRETYDAAECDYMRGNEMKTRCNREV